MGMIYYSENTEQNQQREKVHRVKSEGNQAQASVSPPPVEGPNEFPQQWVVTTHAKCLSELIRNHVQGF